MAEKIKTGDKASEKGGTGYKARRWLDWWTFECTTKGCTFDTEHRDLMEAHVAASDHRGPSYVQEAEE